MLPPAPELEKPLDHSYVKGPGLPTGAPTVAVPSVPPKQEGLVEEEEYVNDGSTVTLYSTYSVLSQPVFGSYCVTNKSISLEVL